MASASSTEELIALLRLLNPNAIKRVHAMAVEEFERQANVEEFMGGVFMNVLALSKVLSIQAAAICAATCRAWATHLSKDILVKIAYADVGADWTHLGLSDALVKAAVSKNMANSIDGQVPAQVGVRPSSLQKASLKAALNGSDVVCCGQYGSGQAMAMLLAALQLLSRKYSFSVKKPSVLILSRDVHLHILDHMCRKLAEHLPFKVNVCMRSKTSHFSAAVEETGAAYVVISTPKAALRDLVVGHQLLQSDTMQHIFIYHCSARLDGFGNEEFLSGVNSPIELELGALLRVEQQMIGARQVCIFGLSGLPGPSVQEAYKQWTPHPVLIGDWQFPSWMPQNSRMLTWQATPHSPGFSASSGSTEHVAAAPHHLLAMAVSNSTRPQSSQSASVASNRRADIKDDSASSICRDQAHSSEPSAPSRELYVEQQETSALVAAHQYIRLLQQERGKTCWALLSKEGQHELESHQQIIQVKLEEALALTRSLCLQHQSLLGATSMMWAGLSCALEEEIWYRCDSYNLQPDKAASKVSLVDEGCLGSGSESVDLSEVMQQFDEVFARFNGRISEIIEATASVVKILPATSAIHTRYRFCSTAAEQLGRERAFLCTFLQVSTILPAQPILMRRISEITGARKLLFGTSQEVGLTGDVVVRGPGGLAGVLGLDSVGNAPLLHWADLKALEDLEARVFSFNNKGSAPPVRQWYLLLTRLIDSIHTRIENDLVQEICNPILGPTVMSQTS